MIAVYLGPGAKPQGYQDFMGCERQSEQCALYALKTLEVLGGWFWMDGWTWKTLVECSDRYNRR